MHHGGKRQASTLCLETSDLAQLARLQEQQRKRRRKPFGNHHPPSFQGTQRLHTRFAFGPQTKEKKEKRSHTRPPPVKHVEARLASAGAPRNASSRSTIRPLRSQIETANRPREPVYRRKKKTGKSFWGGGNRRRCEEMWNEGQSMATIRQ
ncbi:uncharacterized protein EI97DRAFT_59635 [Westerdykella ornata]|uniref:Uncharacterized protein n=1 Tax=Westerdykella ornata TaxID=318751 RepID=A0A6A6JLU9_WESOR|nr:uncharacterized protein EI97DRAFT_59635 [Westerdykella ornata]KAF2275889.1 hypothetical protein EI97DRAFT_59635 [Westerdykella ornata]